MLKKLWNILLYLTGVKKQDHSINENIRITENIVAIVRDKDGNIKQVIGAKNIITNAGDIWFAQMSANETPTNDFKNLVLGSGSTSPAKADDYNDMTVISGTNKAPSVGYPKSNDDDDKNTGKAIDSTTWKFEYETADFNHSAIYEGCVTITSPIAGSKVLCRWLFDTSFEKTSLDTLTVFVNENCLGI